MGVNTNKIGDGIEEVFDTIRCAPEAFHSELDLHNEIYRVLYSKLKKKMYVNKSIKNRKKLINSSYYSDIKKWKRKSIRKRKDRSQVFYDMSIYGRGYDIFLEFKFSKTFGFRQIFQDIKKIMTSTDKVPVGFIVNTYYIDRKPLYKNYENMKRWVSYMIKNFQNNLKWFGVHKNKKTSIYYYFLYHNNIGDYLKIILKIIGSNAKIIKIVYNGKNPNINNL